MSKYCADCVNMATGSHQKGMFKCTNSRSGYDKVSARMLACSYFTECFNSRRCETDRNNYMEISRSYGCYIVTAVVTTLKLEDAKMYINTFDYFRNQIMPELQGGYEWLEDYDTFGPKVALKVSEDEFKCESLFVDYIRPFTNFILCNQVDKAVILYKKMYTNLKNEYGLGTYPKRLVRE